MNKKCAILLRGHTKRIRGSNVIFEDPINFDFSRGALKSFIDSVYMPFSNMYDVDCYFSVSDDYNIDLIKSNFPNCKYSLCVHYDWSAQRLNMLNGLHNIYQSEIIYDKIFISRFDLIYKKNINCFINDMNSNIVYQWAEYPVTPNRVPDAIHWINNDKSNDVFSKFIKSIEYHEPNGSFHDLKNITDQLGMSSSFMIDGYYDANTSRHPDNHGKGLNLSKNPIYVMSGRRYFFDDFTHDSLYEGDWSC